MRAQVRPLVRLPQVSSWRPAKAQGRSRGRGAGKEKLASIQQL